jgi:uncharacterized protein YndB with AHSA1/START domain
MIEFDTHIRIDRPIDEVFSYVSDVGNLPSWNSAVEAARRTRAGEAGEVGSTFVLLRTLPTGPAHNDLEVVDHRRPTRFAIQTTSGPTPFIYRFQFTPEGDATIARLEAEVRLGGAADLLAPLTRRAVRRGVDENLATLKRILETRL